MILIHTVPRVLAQGRRLERLVHHSLHPARRRRMLLMLLLLLLARHPLVSLGRLSDDALDVGGHLAVVAL